MAISNFIATCTKNEPIAREIHEVRFTKPSDFTFKAGQFVLWDVPLVDDPEDIQTRAYSIASAPHEDELIFIVKILPEGRAGRWVSQVLKEGTEVRMQGPMGVFVMDPAISGDCVMVCTGTGFAPLRSQIMDALERGDTRRFDVFIGSLSEEFIFWEKEWKQFCEEHPNVAIHYALDKPSDSWTGHKGWVQTLIPKVIENFAGKNVFICGNPKMTKDVKELCTNKWSVPADRIHMEGYI